jgi:hypothetical protein
MEVCGEWHTPVINMTVSPVSHSAARAPGTLSNTASSESSACRPGCTDDDDDDDEFTVASTV